MSWKSVRAALATACLLAGFESLADQLDPTVQAAMPASEAERDGGNRETPGANGQTIADRLRPTEGKMLPKDRAETIRSEIREALRNP